MRCQLLLEKATGWWCLMRVFLFTFLTWFGWQKSQFQNADSVTSISSLDIRQEKPRRKLRNQCNQLKIDCQFHFIHYYLTKLDHTRFGRQQEVLKFSLFLHLYYKVLISDIYIYYIWQWLNGRLLQYPSVIQRVAVQFSISSENNLWMSSYWECTLKFK